MERRGINRVGSWREEIKAVRKTKVKKDEMDVETKREIKRREKRKHEGNWLIRSHGKKLDEHLNLLRLDVINHILALTADSSEVKSIVAAGHLPLFPAMTAEIQSKGLRSHLPPLSAIHHYQLKEEITAATEARTEVIEIPVKYAEEVISPKTYQIRVRTRE